MYISLPFELCGRLWPVFESSVAAVASSSAIWSTWLRQVGDKNALLVASLKRVDWLMLATFLFSSWHIQLLLARCGLAEATHGDQRIGNVIGHVVQYSTILCTNDLGLVGTNDIQ